MTNLAGEAQSLSEATYCARGEMEKRLQKQPRGLLADRTRCQGWGANPFRRRLSRAADVLVASIRRLALGGTALARAQGGTLRRKLLPISALVTRNPRRIRRRWRSAYPRPALFAQVAARLRST